MVDNIHTFEEPIHGGQVLAVDLMEVRIVGYVVEIAPNNRPNEITDIPATASVGISYGGGILPVAILEEPFDSNISDTTLTV